MTVHHLRLPAGSGVPLKGANRLPTATPTHAELQPLFAASASAGVLWELVLLQQNYHPDVAAKAKAVVQRSSAGNTSSMSILYGQGTGSQMSVRRKMKKMACITCCTELQATGAAAKS